ncbi:MAG: hypothetical protein WBR15_06860 [Gammaproteobacteria bacterium]
MAKLDLNLRENAIDSLNEALSKYQQGQSGDGKAYKFCVVHLSHFLELLLKYYVTKCHPLFIYKDPFANKITEESRTIGLNDAINFLANEGMEMEATFLSDLVWLKKMRNRIEHHRFTMNIEQVNAVIGRLVKAAHDFNVTHKGIDLTSVINQAQYDIFNELAQTYEYRLKQALQKVEAAKIDAYKRVRCKEWEFVNFHIYTCDSCGNETLIPSGDSATGYRCTFCGGEESEEIEEDCGVCGDKWPVGMMAFEDWTGSGESLYVYPRCGGSPEYVNDD